MTSPRRAARLGNAAVLGSDAVELATRVQAVQTAQGAEVLRLVPVDQLTRSPYQPRKVMDPVALAELADSIRARGVLEPLLVRETATGALELLAGERRLEGAKLAGLDVVPARVLAGLSDAEAREVALVENLAREDLTPWEEAHAVASLRDARKAEGKPADVRALAAVIGRGKSTTAELLTIADQLTPTVLARASAGGPLVRSPDTLPHEALYGAARGETQAERARLLALYAGATAPARLVAQRKKRRRAARQGVRPYTLKGGPDARFSLTVRSAVDTLAPHDAAGLLEALRPLLDALTTHAREGAVTLHDGT